jgi:hypothetical protein
MTRSHHFALVALGLCFFFGLAAYGEGPVPLPEVAKLVNHEIKNISTELAKAKLLKKGQKRVRGAAFMIAVYAQNAKDNAPAMATLRDQALRLMKAGEAGKIDEAKALAATLRMDIKPDAAAKPGPVQWHKQLDLEPVMHMFSNEKGGGFGMEKALEDLGEAKTLDAGQLEQAALLGQKVSMIARVVHDYAPTSDQGPKTKKSWNALATEMQTEAGDLAAAAQAKKGPEVAKLANKVSTTCTKCHDIFR